MPLWSSAVCCVHPVQPPPPPSHGVPQITDGIGGFAALAAAGTASAVSGRAAVPPRPAHRAPARPDSDQAAQLDDRLGVILDAQVADPVDSLARLAPCADALDHDRGGLLSALVATRSLPRLERRD